MYIFTQVHRTCDNIAYLSILLTRRKHEIGRDFKEGPRTRDERRDEEYVGKRVMGIEVRGSGRRGRPKKRWADCVKDGLREKVYDRAAWRRLSSHIDPT